jgi:hypothetical protein
MYVRVSAFNFVIGNDIGVCENALRVRMYLCVCVYREIFLIVPLSPCFPASLHFCMCVWVRMCMCVRVSACEFVRGIDIGVCKEALRVRMYLCVCL